MRKFSEHNKVGNLVWVSYVNCQESKFLAIILARNFTRLDYDRKHRELVDLLILRDGSYYHQLDLDRTVRVIRPLGFAPWDDKEVNKPWS